MGSRHNVSRGVQYLSSRYSDRLTECGIAASAGTTGDSYDNALAESLIGLSKTELIGPRGPWQSVDAVEYATLEWNVSTTRVCSSLSAHAVSGPEL